VSWREKLLQPYMRKLLEEALGVVGWTLVQYSRKYVRAVNDSLNAPLTDIRLTMRVAPENCSLTKLMWYICSYSNFGHWQCTSWEAWL